MSLLVDLMECITGIVRACGGVNEVVAMRIDFVVSVFTEKGVKDKNQLLD